MRRGSAQVWNLIRVHLSKIILNDHNKNSASRMGAQHALCMCATGENERINNANKNEMRIIHCKTNKKTKTKTKTTHTKPNRTKCWRFWIKWIIVRTPKGKTKTLNHNGMDFIFACKNRKRTKTHGQRVANSEEKESALLLLKMISNRYAGSTHISMQYLSQISFHSFVQSTIFV